MIRNTTRWTTDTMQVRMVAALLGCTPNNGLSLAMNEMREKGIIEDDATYGEITKAYCQFKIEHIDYLNTLDDEGVAA